MSQKNKKLVGIGKPDHVSLLRTFGAVAFEVNNEEELREVLKTIESRIQEFGTILITSDAFSGEKNIKKIQSLGIPVISIPTHRNESNSGQKNMERLVAKAVGMSLDFLK